MKDTGFNHVNCFAHRMFYEFSLPSRTQNFHSVKRFSPNHSHCLRAVAVD